MNKYTRIWFSVELGVLGTKLCLPIPAFPHIYLKETLPDN